ncbi:MAG: MFS transporter [Deltaproteobacteria bacterium]|nr:MFS transporter [Deltaproteobacteria bacterium]
MSVRSRPGTILTMNTLAFTACFAVWMMNGVLITFLVENKVFAFDQVQIGWLLGIPVLTGSLLRLPVGMATDRWGGRVVFPVVMVAAALGALALSYADGYGGFLIGSLGFGLSGTGFAVGIAYTSVWFKKEHQGTALGVFGVGNAGSALTSMGAPWLLKWMTDGGTQLDNWRMLPRLYAGVLIGMTLLFLLLTENKKVEGARRRTLGEQLRPLKQLRVWRFGLYYFLVFGGFVALAQWLIPYYVSVYGASLATAGLLAAVFSLPSGLIRALGGWMSDKLGARTTMYWVLGACVLGSLLLIVPRMEITSPGASVMARGKGVVTAVSPEAITVGTTVYQLKKAPPQRSVDDDLIWPHLETWQSPAVQVGDPVVRKQLLARGVTHIVFQANIWVFTALAFLVGIAMGIGKAAVYKHIPEYFPRDVGVVGGLVGVIGGLGGFVGPILFGYLLRGTGLWTSCWMFFAALSLVCLIWMHLVIRRMVRRRTPEVADHMEHEQAHEDRQQSAASPRLSGAPQLGGQS